MINYEKIKTGKSLTKNQKRLHNFYLQHQQNMLTDCDLRDYKINRYVDAGNDVKYYGNTIKSSRDYDFNIFYKDSVMGYRVDVCEDITYPYRGKYSGFCKQRDIINLFVGRKNIVAIKKRKAGYIDGILTLYNAKGQLCSVDIEVNHRKKQAITIAETPVYLVRRKISGKYIYAHGDTRRDALLSLRVKLSSERRFEERFNVNLRYDSYIDITDYILLTGACLFGCKEFCKKHNIDIGGKISVCDLLKILQPTDFGYRDILAKLDIPYKYC